MNKRPAAKIAIVPTVGSGRPRTVRPLGMFILLLFLALPLAVPASADCDYIPRGKSFWVRLLDPVASYSSRPGASVRAVLIQSPECGATPVFPAGLELDGEVVAARKVGLGIVHDTAYVKIQFTRLVTSDGQVLPISSEVVEVDNARETVRKGVIQGVRSTDVPQGRITSGLIHLPTFNPYGDMGLILYRSFSVLPEPEIYLPPGTDLRLQLTGPLYVADQPEIPPHSFQLDEIERGDIEQVLQNVSVRTATGSGKDADVVNMMFLGSQEQLEKSFEAVGWRGADHNNPHAVLKQFGAVLTFTSYATMPISTQYLSGEPQDFTWQKSFDSYGKREHIRVWREPGLVQNEHAWLSAYTRETSAALSLRYHQFIHHIDANLDDDVNMLVRDLTLSGCVDSVYLLPRPDVQHQMVNATGDEMRTDGMLTVVQLKDCNRPDIEYTRLNPLIPIRPRSRVVRYFRNEILLYKSDVVRGNILYGAFDLCRMGLHSLRHRHDAGTDPDDGLPVSPVSPQTLFPNLEIGEIPLGR
ncbi:MAG: LssY C-terminal domain-containing protein [Candidatus Acidiferrum sp.]